MEQSSWPGNSLASTARARADIEHVPHVVMHLTMPSAQCGTTRRLLQSSRLQPHPGSAAHTLTRSAGCT
eukprot:1158241-Pelagomonas_calceolata.AAC.3